MNHSEGKYGSISNEMDIGNGSKKVKRLKMKEAIDKLLKSKFDYNDEILVSHVIQYAILCSNSTKVLVQYYRMGVGVALPKMYECISMLYYYKCRYDKAYHFLELGNAYTDNRECMAKVLSKQMNGMVNAITHFEHNETEERRNALIQLPYNTIVSLLKLSEHGLIN